MDARLNQPRPQQIALVVLSDDAFALDRARADDEEDDVEDDDVEARRATRASATTRDTDASDVIMISFPFVAAKSDVLAAPSATLLDDRTRRERPKTDDGETTTGRWETENPTERVRGESATGEDGRVWFGAESGGWKLGGALCENQRRGERGGETTGGGATGDGGRHWDVVRRASTDGFGG